MPKLINLIDNYQLIIMDKIMNDLIKQIETIKIGVSLLTSIVNSLIN